MLFNRIRFCVVKGKLIREVECAACTITAAERYDRRLMERRAGSKSVVTELRQSNGRRVKNYYLCPGFFRLAILKIFYPFFKTSHVFVFITLFFCAAVLLIATGHFKPFRKTKKAAAPNISSEDIQKNFSNFAGQIRREFTEYSGKNKYSIQIVVTAEKIIDGFREKFPRIPEGVPGDVIDSIFMDAFDFYFNGANVLFENYFYVEDDQLNQLIRRLEILLFDTVNLFSDWEKVSGRMPAYSKNHVHIVRVRQIKKSLDLFKGNIIKLKSGNILEETLSVPAPGKKN